MITKLFHAYEDTSPLESLEQKKANKAEERFWNILDKKEKRFFSDYQEMRVVVEDQCAEKDFWQGFCAGCRLMIEVHKTNL